MENVTFYKELLDEISDGVYFVNKERRITFWNKSAEELSGYSRDEVIGRCCSDNLLVHIDDEGTQLCTGGCPLAATINDAVPRQAHVFMKHKNGHRLPIYVRVRPLFDENNRIIGGVETFSDDSADNFLKERLAVLEKMALIDGLTGAGNRRFADITLSMRFTELERYGWPFGVILFDIGNFKRVNDTYGHNTGDAVLKMLVRTIAPVIRGPQTSFFRWGGEEFLVAASNCDAASLLVLAERIRIGIAGSVLTEKGATVRVTVSAGATTAAAGDTPESIISRVDKLLYQAKQSGKNCSRAG